MGDPSTWREFLGQLIRDSQEKQRIAAELGINSATLVRWVHNETDPRPQNLRQLLKALPHHRQKMRELVAVEFSEFSTDAKDGLPQDLDTSREIPSASYAVVLHTYVNAPKRQRFWSVSNVILQEALRQLDPSQQGMTISVAQCVPPRAGWKVRSLREHIGRGTHPWKATLKHEVAFLGIESLAGYSVANSRMLTSQDKSERQMRFPAKWLTWEESAVACPIMHEGRIAGCLLFSSTQPNYFLPFRETLIQQYAELMVLAFEPEEFYDQQDIQLELMPSYEIQEEHFSNLRQRISNAMAEGSKMNSSMTIGQTELMVWQQLEEELIQHALNNRE